MNRLALLSMFADSLHVWAPIPVFNSFSLKMSLMHFVHVTVEILCNGFSPNIVVFGRTQ